MFDNHKYQAAWHRMYYRKHKAKVRYSAYRGTARHFIKVANHKDLVNIKSLVDHELNNKENNVHE